MAGNPKLLCIAMIMDPPKRLVSLVAHAQSRIFIQLIKLPQVRDLKDNVRQKGDFVIMNL